MTHQPDRAASAPPSDDLRELRAADRTARDLSDHLALALQAGGLGTWRWDLRTGLTIWDERLEALFGLAPGTFDGTYDAYVALLHPDDREAVLDRVRVAIETRSTYRVDHRVVWPDGSTHWISGAGGAALDEQGEVVGTVGCCSDITDQVTHARERERLVRTSLETVDRERVLRERLEFLSAIHEVLASMPDRRDLMVGVTRAAVPGLGDWCALHLLPDPNAADARRHVPDVEIAHADPAMVGYARQLQQRFPYDPDAPAGVAHVIRTGETSYIPVIDDAALDELDTADAERELVGELALRSSITVPIIKRNRMFGALQLVMTSSSRAYTADDVALAHVVAGRIAASLDNRRLNEQQRHIADTLQQSLLPQSLPAVPGIGIAVRYWPAGEATTVGGDFYDLFAVDDDTWALVIGDVCGTGPAAAALTGLARHTIRDSVWHGDEPVAILGALNRAILRSDTRSFCTALYAELTAGTGPPRLRLACGGHPLPIHVTDSGARTLGGPGTLLGIFRDTSFTEEEVVLRHGDVVVLYTDGATDVPAPHGLAPDELRALVAEAVERGGDAEHIADLLHEELGAVLAFDDRADDIALIVVTVGPAPAGPI